MTRQIARRLVSLAVLPALAVIVGSGGAKPAYAAATITVNTTSDEAVTDGNCSLREAINNANANSDTTGGDCAAGSPGADTIDLSALSGTITLGSGLPAITDDVTIGGPGASTLTINANGNLNVFQLFTTQAAIAGLTLTGATAGAVYNTGTTTLSDDSISGNNNTDFSGRVGGVLNFGTLTIRHSAINGNSGITSGGILNNGTLLVSTSTLSGNVGRGGGAISNNGFLTVESSTVSGNTAAVGGGIASGNNATINNSTIANNTAMFSGGGIYGGGLIENTTITGNSSGFGAGIFSGGNITLVNSIVAGQTGGPNCVIGAGFPASDGGYNLDDGTSCNFSPANHSLSNTNPMLDPAGLGNNGGPTQTIALLPGSPAIDAIPPNFNGCGTTITSDQRGVSRPQGPGCDIGAFEVAPPAADLSITKSGAPNPVVSGNRLAYTLTVTNNGPQDATGVTVTDPLPDNVHFNSVASTQGTCTRSATKPLPKDGTITCSLGNLANAASASVTMVVTTTTPGTLTNTATVSGNQTDPNPLNNSAAATTTVIGT